MRWTVALVLVAVVLQFAGCSDPNVKYDELRDETRIGKYFTRGEFLGRKTDDISSHLYFGLSGKGRRPVTWEASLSINVGGLPKESPLLLGDHVKVELGGFREISTFTTHRDDYKDGMRLEEAFLLGSDGPTIDDFVRLAEGYPLKINDHGILLTKAERDEIRQLVVSARRLGNQ